MNKNIIINRPLKFRPNSIAKVNELNTKFASIDKNTSKGLIKIFNYLQGKLDTLSNMNSIEESLKSVQKNNNFKRTKKLETTSGFTLTYIIIYFGIIGISFLAFLVAKSMVS